MQLPVRHNPGMIFNCSSNFNLSQTQKKKLKSRDSRVSKMINGMNLSILSIINKHAVGLVWKCIDGVVCYYNNIIIIIITTTTTTTITTTIIISLSVTCSVKQEVSCHQLIYHSKDGIQHFNGIYCNL